MKVLFSSQAVVEYDGQHYYSNSIQATYKRYLPLGTEITVVCFCRRTKKPTNDMIDDNKVSFIFVNKGLIINKKSVIKQQVEISDYCVVHVPCEHSYFIFDYSRKISKPCLNVVCGCPWDSLWNYNWMGKILAPYAYFSLKKVQKKATHSIYVTQDFLQRRYPTSGLAIGCSNANVKTGNVEVLEKRLKMISTIEASSRVLRIGTAAALNVPYKGQEYVIRAISILQRHGLTFEYHLIGGGDDSRLREIVKKERVENLVFFHGSLPHTEVLDFMDNIDIYIQPSKQEGLPRATIEAMSRGCLCLGSDIAGIPELLDDKYLFPKGNIHRIVKILENINLKDLSAQANINFDKSKNYDKQILDERRNNFILRFKNDSII